MPVKYRMEETQRKHLNTILQMLFPVFPDSFVSFERHVCVSFIKTD